MALAAYLLAGWIDRKATQAASGAGDRHEGFRVTNEQPENQSTFELISNLVLEMSYLYSFHQSVFKSKDRIGQMKEISDSLFGLIQRSLQHDIIRMICGLTDPPGGGERANATIPRLIGELESVDSNCFGRCQGIFSELSDPLASIRTHRHKRLFHIDLKTRVQRNDNLPRMLFGHIDSAVDGICRIMNEAYKTFNDSSTDFREIIDPSQASSTFNWMISDCIRFKYLRTLATDPKVSDKTLRLMVSERSGRNNERYLAEDD